MDMCEWIEEERFLLMIDSCHIRKAYCIFLHKVKANYLVRCSVLLQVCFTRDAMFSQVQLLLYGVDPLRVHQA